MSIFDKVVGSVNRGVAAVGANSKAMMEKARVKTVISNLETERKQLAELLGMKVYEGYMESGQVTVDEGLVNFVTEINRRYEGIAEQQAELKRIEDEVSQVTGAKAGAGFGETDTVCACGNPIAPGTKFCPKCGSAVQG